MIIKTPIYVFAVPTAPQPDHLLMITSVYQPYLKAYKIKFPGILAQIAVSMFFFHLPYILLKILM